MTFTFFPLTRVNMGASIFFAAAMIHAFSHGLVCRRALCVLCTKSTLHSNHRLTVWYSNTQNDFSPGAAIFSLHILASPSCRNMNYDEKQLTGEKKLSCSFYLYRFRKYVSYGFPVINFCNPGVHYETPCIITFQWDEIQQKNQVVRFLAITLVHICVQ